MRKRVFAFLFITTVCLFFSSCWDYRSLDELTIVAGMAVDKSENDPSLYSITFELVDLNATGNQDEMKSMLLESEGPTVFQAIHNASSKFHNEMYFGNMDVLILSEEVAEEPGLNKIINAILRDYSMRDTLSVLISREETARDIIMPQEGREGVASYNISQGINQKTTSLNSTKVYDLIGIYNKLSSGASNIALPAFRFVEDNEKKQLKTDGAAIFKGDRLMSFLDEADMPYFLFITEKLNSGSYTFYTENGEYATLVLKSSSPEISFSHDEDGLVIHVGIKAVTGAIDLSPDHKNYSGEDIARLENEAGISLNNRITELINTMQSEAGAEIFGFGIALSKKEPAYWVAVKDDWEAVFRKAKIIVNSEIIIKDTGFINRY